VVRQKQLRKALLLVLLSFSDCKRLALDRSLSFIIANFHSEIKPQVNSNKDMKSPEIYTIQNV